MLPIGLRQNNPGNILCDNRWKWRGQYPAKNGDYLSFDTMENGLRALAKNLLTYYDTRNLDTVRKIISRWAPPPKNDTVAYIKNVCKRMNVTQDAVISLRNRNTLHLLIAAIGEQENGPAIFNAYVKDAQIVAAINAALSGR